MTKISVERGSYLASQELFVLEISLVQPLKAHPD